MGRGAVIGCLLVATTVPCRAADDAIDARRAAEAKRLLVEQDERWQDEIAGFNRAHAPCETAAAKADAAYDAGHGTRFERTLGWNWDAASSAWRPAAPAKAEVRLIVSGPVKSGTTTLDGRTQAFCRAEAPDKLKTSARLEPTADGSVTTESHGYDLPAVASGFDGSDRTFGPRKLVGTGETTPRPQVEARIAKAASRLDEGLSWLDAILAGLNRSAGCAEDTARLDLDDRVIRTLTFGSRYDAARATWEPADEDEAEVVLVIQGHTRSGPTEDGTRFACRAMMLPITVTATARWKQEGDKALTFRIEVPPAP